VLLFPSSPIVELVKLMLQEQTSESQQL